MKRIPEIYGATVKSKELYSFICSRPIYVCQRHRTEDYKKQQHRLFSFCRKLSLGKDRGDTINTVGLYIYIYVYATGFAKRFLYKSVFRFCKFHEV